MLPTVSFALCFAVWGLIGALARLRVGILADRLGARLVFTVLMAVSAVPPLLVPLAADYRSLLAIAFALGLAGASFAVGVDYDFAFQLDATTATAASP